jgi:short-subunit dehydrogenase
MVSRAAAANARLNRLPRFLVGDAESVADAGYRACMAGATICVPGAVNEAVTAAARATPRWLLRRITGTLAKRIE